MTQERLGGVRGIERFIWEVGSFGRRAYSIDVDPAPSLLKPLLLNMISPSLLGLAQQRLFPLDKRRLASSLSPGDLLQPFRLGGLLMGVRRLARRDEIELRRG